MLARLSGFPAAILVAGCQRSGTTVVTRILRDAIEMHCPKYTRDDELDAALILCGAVPFEATGRCCFQTTYVNDHFREYAEHDDFRMIWIIRNPEAVIRSMLYHWRRGALKRLFRACGRHALDERGIRRLERFGTLGFGRAEMACLSYNVKTAQVHDLAAWLGPDRLYILDYDDLIGGGEDLLPEMFSFCSVAYDERFRRRLIKRKKPGGDQLDTRLRKKIHDICDSEYGRALGLAKSWRTQQRVCEIP